jgi:TonB family protein
MKRMIFIAALLSLTLLAAMVSAQDQPKVINGGVLNGKAIKLPKPVYPEEARAAKLQGTVSIQVVIDEEGNVIEATPASSKLLIDKSVDDGSGAAEAPDSILIEAARAAALEAQFSPTKLSGVPVKVTGVITYNFSLTETKDLKSISGGLLNGKAVSLPAPEYPAAAKAVKASGAVAVQVLVDEEGNVIAATAVSGHPLLRASAVDAARAAKFEPTRLSGEAVKVSGVLTYNFALPDGGQN